MDETPEEDEVVQGSLDVLEGDSVGKEMMSGPVFLRCVTDQTAKVGTRARFLAEIVSSSTLTVTWYFNSQPVEPDAGSRYKILQEGNFYCNPMIKLITLLC